MKCSYKQLYWLSDTGHVGELTMALSDLLWDDMVSGPETERIPVSYTQWNQAPTESKDAMSKACSSYGHIRFLWTWIKGKYLIGHVPNSDRFSVILCIYSLRTRLFYLSKLDDCIKWKGRCAFIRAEVCFKFIEAKDEFSNEGLLEDKFCSTLVKIWDKHGNTLAKTVWKKNKKKSNLEIWTMSW